MDSQEPHFLVNNGNYTKLHNACQYRKDIFGQRMMIVAP